MASISLLHGLHLRLSVLELAFLLPARRLQGLKRIHEVLDLLVQGHAVVRKLDAGNIEVRDIRLALRDDVLGGLIAG
eukprot:2444052-Heterocapsa_arctica.AAC.1